MAQQGKFLILVVLYKVPLLESPTIRSLLRASSRLAASKVLIWDNSPSPAASQSDLDRLRCSVGEVEYVTTPENLSLSTIYNRTIQSWLRQHTYLVIFDHDSEFDASFFVLIEKATRTHPSVPLFLPIVTYANGIVSPANMFYFKGWPWRRKKVGLVRSRFHTAINSGMVISARFLETKFGSYDERFRFYGTDNSFMQSYAKLERHFCVVDVKIAHRLDFYEERNSTAKVVRMREINRATLLLAGGNPFMAALSRAYVLLTSAKHAVRHWDWRFMV
jgi:hypothetical protein